MIEVNEPVPADTGRRRPPRALVWVAAVAAAVVGLMVVVVVIVIVARPDERPADACGEALDKPDGGRWDCTFADDFDGTELDADRWIVPHGPPTGAPGWATCPVDDPRNVSVADGRLRLSVTPADDAAGPVVCEAVAAADYAGGTVASYHRFSQAYGRFEARMRTSDVRTPGLHEAFWLWPDDRYPDPRGVDWPAAGEIDIAETYSQYPDLAVPFLHYGPDDNGGPVLGTNTAHCAAKRGGWHTYTLEWTAEELRIDVDGVTCLVNTSGDPAFDRRYIVILMAGLGHGGNAPTSDLRLPVTLEVDYVRVWE